MAQSDVNSHNMCTLGKNPPRVISFFLHPEFVFVEQLWVSNFGVPSFLFLTKFSVCVSFSVFIIMYWIMYGV